MHTWVVWGRRRYGRHHPTVKLVLAALLGVVAIAAVPQLALASPPTVQPPTGPGSGGSFTGPYTFATYISCASGVSYADSYGNGLDGTHSFGFYGSLDGSLLVRIDGGGYQLINSCGDPFTGARALVASYTVSKNVSASTPAPTPAPTPVPTLAPTPAPGGVSGGSQSGTTGSGSAHSSGSSAGSGSAGGASSAAPAGSGSSSSGAGVSSVKRTPQPGARAGDGDAATGTPAPVEVQAGVTPAIVPAGTTGAGNSSPSPRPSQTGVGSGSNTGVTGAAAGAGRAGGLMIAGLWGLALAVVVAALVIAWRHTGLRHYAADLWLGLKIVAEPRLFRLRQWLRARTRGRDEPRRRFVGRHAHTGRLLAHHHTNYGHLGVMLAMATVAVAVTSVGSRADISGTSTVSLTVQGPPPTTIPTIAVPSDGDEMPSDTATIRGDCEPGLFVGIYRNTVGAGSVVCPPAGVYAVLISLVDGDNELVAYNVDGLGQKGPASNPVVVHYTAPPPPTPTPRPSVMPTPLVTLRPSATSTPAGAPATSATPRPAARPTTAPTPKPAPGAPYYLTTDNLYYQGATTGQLVSVPIRIAGGRPPYQVAWDWGDGSSASTFATSSPVTGTYTYRAPGTYRLTVTAFDASGRRALVTIAVIVSGEPVVTTTATSDGRGQWGGLLDGSLLIAWPILIMAILTVVCFWLGERREYRHRERVIRPSAS